MAVDEDFLKELLGRKEGEKTYKKYEAAKLEEEALEREEESLSIQESDLLKRQEELESKEGISLSDYSEGKADIRVLEELEVQRQVRQLLEEKRKIEARKQKLADRRQQLKKRMDALEKLNQELKQKQSEIDKQTHEINKIKQEIRKDEREIREADQKLQIPFKKKIEVDVPWNTRINLLGYTVLIILLILATAGFIYKTLEAGQLDGQLEQQKKMEEIMVQNITRLSSEVRQKDADLRTKEGKLAICLDRFEENINSAREERDRYAQLYNQYLEESLHWKDLYDKCLEENTQESIYQCVADSGYNPDNPIYFYSNRCGSSFLGNIETASIQTGLNMTKVDIGILTEDELGLTALMECFYGQYSEGNPVFGECPKLLCPRTGEMQVLTGRASMTVLSQMTGFANDCK